MKPKAGKTGLSLLNLFLISFFIVTTGIILGFSITKARLRFIPRAYNEENTILKTENSLIYEENGKYNIDEKELLEPSKIDTQISLDGIEEIDFNGLILPGSNSRFVANVGDYDKDGYLKRDAMGTISETIFQGFFNKLQLASQSNINLTMLLVITEDQSEQWIVNTIQDTYKEIPFKGFILGNELNLKIFGYKRPEIYYSQLMTAYRTVKGISPNIKVYPYGTSPGGLDPAEKYELALETLLNYFDANSFTEYQKYPFDGINIHLYFPNQISQGISDAKSILAEHKADLSIIIGETGLPVNDTKPREWESFNNTPEDQADYYWQATMLGLVQGVTYMNYFTSKDYPVGDNMYWGIIRMDGIPRPAFAAYQFAQRIINNVKTINYEKLDGISIYKLIRSDGAIIRILWNETDKSIKFSDLKNNTLIYNKLGDKMYPNQNENDGLNIELLPRKTMFVGGDVVIVVDVDESYLYRENNNLPIPE
jgi:hypothetical protein